MVCFKIHCMHVVQHVLNIHLQLMWEHSIVFAETFGNFKPRLRLHCFFFLNLYQSAFRDVHLFRYGYEHWDVRESLYSHSISLAFIDFDSRLHGTPVPFPCKCTLNVGITWPKKDLTFYYSSQYALNIPILSLQQLLLDTLVHFWLRQNSKKVHLRTVGNSSSQRNKR